MLLSLLLTPLLAATCQPPPTPPRPSNGPLAKYADDWICSRDQVAAPGAFLGGVCTPPLYKITIYANGTFKTDHLSVQSDGSPSKDGSITGSVQDVGNTPPADLCSQNNDSGYGICHSLTFHNLPSAWGNATVMPNGTEFQFSFDDPNGSKHLIAFVSAKSAAAGNAPFQPATVTGTGPGRSAPFQLSHRTGGVNWTVTDSAAVGGADCSQHSAALYDSGGHQYAEAGNLLLDHSPGQDDSGHAQLNAVLTTGTYYLDVNVCGKWSFTFTENG